jgi:uncharacterized protein
MRTSDQTLANHSNARRRVARLAVCAGFAGLGVLAAAAPAKAQDFDCRSATNAAERTICARPRLARLDERMAELYGLLWARLDNDNREGLRDYQRMFLATRDKCGRDVSCIEGAYLDQIDVLRRQLERQPRRG